MSDKTYKQPPVTWLKVTDYLHGWLNAELAGGARVREQRIISVAHLKGAKDVLAMQTTDNTDLSADDVGTTMSATMRNAIDAGIRYDAAAVEQIYGVTKEALRLYVPIECPENAVTDGGVVRPWSHDICFSHKQAVAMQRLLRERFWQAVSDYAQEYAREHRGEKYAQQDMIEAFCQATKTDDIHVEALRREWQRRVKRKASP